MNSLLEGRLHLLGALVQALGQRRVAERCAAMRAVSVDEM